MKKLLFITLIVLSSCKTDVKKEKTYQLIWSDEFNQEEKRLDSSKWFLETIAPNNGSWTIMNYNTTPTELITLMLVMGP